MYDLNRGDKNLFKFNSAVRSTSTGEECENFQAGSKKGEYVDNVKNSIIHFCERSFKPFQAQSLPCPYLLQTVR